MNFKNLTDLFTFFKDEETCKTYLATQRWNGVIVCPHCNSEKVYKTNRGFKCADKTCSKKFSVTVGTIFENSKISLRTWFAAIYLCTSSKKGVSSLQLSRQLGITQKTAWFVLHRIREMLKDKAPQMLNNEVQIDETYVGGKEGNKHGSKKSKTKYGASIDIKTPVIGLYEKDGKVITHVAHAVSKKIIEGLIEKHMGADTIMVTDASRLYHHVQYSFTHHMVNHANGEYVVNGFHTNGIENFWSVLKRGINGIYHQVSPKHLHRYCNEFSGRYNTRKIADNVRFELTVQNSEGRLKYQELIKK